MALLIKENFNAKTFSNISDNCSETFLKSASADKLNAVFANLYATYGSITKMDSSGRRADAIIYLTHFQKADFTMYLHLDEDGNIDGLLFQPVVAGVAPPLQSTLEPPFKNGDKWFVFWGGETVEQNYHNDYPQQKYAYDLVAINKRGITHKGGGKSNTDYYAFGREIHAVAEGKVVEVIDTVHENLPGIMNANTPLGNHVIIEINKGEYATYAHLKLGSTNVRAGERVQTGALLGLCGNSGNSSEPHLHFQVQTNQDLMLGLGIKTMFNYLHVKQGKTTSIRHNYTPVKGDVIWKVE